MNLSGMGLVVTAHSSQPSASTQSELNLLLSGIKIAERQEGKKKKHMEDPFQTAKRENQKLLVLAQSGEGQSLLHRGSRDNRCMSQGYSGLHC